MLWDTHKCETVGLYKQLICFMFYNLQCKKRITNNTRAFFLCVSVYTGAEPCRPLQLLTQPPSLPREFKGARGGKIPRYTSQTCLPCSGWLKIILHPCACHQLSWCTLSRSCRSLLLWQQYGITQILSSSSLSSYLSPHHCHSLWVPCFSLPMALQLPLKLGWGTQLG